MEKIMYYSTTGKSPLVDRKTAIVQGQPPDGGLYCPTRIPRFEPGEIQSLRGKSFAEVAFAVMRKFHQAEIPDPVVEKICADAYDFPYPVEKVYGRNYVERLGEGPSGAFKDTAARYLARELSHYQRDSGREFIVLVSTSGDTGGAIARSFRGVPGIIVIVLYPRDITKRQAAVINTCGENVIALESDKPFNPLQDICIQAFADPDLKKFNLTSANSINFGRANPQVIHFIYPLTRPEIGGQAEDVVYSIPSGNFGHTYAWFLGQLMGAYAERGVIATNENDTFVRFWKTGKYEIRRLVKCKSDAMNVNNPSNLRRIVDLYGGQMIGKEVVKAPDLEALRRDCYATSVTDNKGDETIKRIYYEYGCMLEPHGAVGWAGLEEYLATRQDVPLAVCMETAHPAKFPEELEELGIHPEAPAWMKEMEKKKSFAVKFPGGFPELKEFIVYGEHLKVVQRQMAESASQK